MEVMKEERGVSNIATLFYVTAISLMLFSAGLALWFWSNQYDTIPVVKVFGLSILPVMMIVGGWILLIVAIGVVMFLLAPISSHLKNNDEGSNR
jgi:hypothetical protein